MISTNFLRQLGEIIGSIDGSIERMRAIRKISALLSREVGKRETRSFLAVANATFPDETYLGEWDPRTTARVLVEDYDGDRYKREPEAAAYLQELDFQIEAEQIRDLMAYNAALMADIAGVEEADLESYFEEIIETQLTPEGLREALVEEAINDGHAPVDVEAALKEIEVTWRRDPAWLLGMCRKHWDAELAAMKSPQ